MAATNETKVLPYASQPLRSHLPISTIAVSMFCSFCFAACLPIWTAWYFSPWEGLGEQRPLWEAVKQIPVAFKNLDGEGLWLLFVNFGLNIVGTIVCGICLAAFISFVKRAQAKVKPSDRSASEEA